MTGSYTICNSSNLRERFPHSPMWGLHILAGRTQECVFFLYIFLKLSEILNLFEIKYKISCVSIGLSWALLIKDVYLLNTYPTYLDEYSKIANLE